MTKHLIRQPWLNSSSRIGPQSEEYCPIKGFQDTPHVKLIEASWKESRRNHSDSSNRLGSSRRLTSLVHPFLRLFSQFQRFVLIFDIFVPYSFELFGLSSGHPRKDSHHRPKQRLDNIHSIAPIVLQRFENKAVKHLKSNSPCPASSFDHSSSSSSSLVSLTALSRTNTEQHQSNLSASTEQQFVLQPRDLTLSLRCSLSHSRWSTPLNSSGEGILVAVAVAVVALFSVAPIVSVVTADKDREINRRIPHLIASANLHNSPHARRLPFANANSTFAKFLIYSKHVNIEVRS